MNIITSQIIMPFSNVLHLDIKDKLRATKKAGLSALSIQPQEVKRIIQANRISLQDLKSMADDMGVVFSRIDPLCTWVPQWQAINFDQKFNEEHPTSPCEFFEIATNLGASTLSLNAIFPSNLYSIDELAHYFYLIDQMANGHGLICDLEPIPMWGIKTIEEAWKIIQMSGSKYGGLVFDSVHFIRSHSSLNMLDVVPAERIHSVQISDGLLQLGDNVSLEEDCFFRKWPGDGEFPLIEMLQYLQNKGALTELCAEVFSFENKGKSLEQIAYLSYYSIEKFLRKAKIDKNELNNSITLKKF